MSPAGSLPARHTSPLVVRGEQRRRELKVTCCKSVCQQGWVEGGEKNQGENNLGELLRSIRQTEKLAIQDVNSG